MFLVSPAGATFDSLCELTVYEGQLKLGIRTIGIGLGTISYEGFTFTASPMYEKNMVDHPPVAMRIGRNGYTVSTLMQGRSGALKLEDPSNFKAIAKCQR